MKHKKLFVSLTAVISVIIFLSIFLMIWFYGDSYEEFDGGKFQKEIEIPGLSEGAVPQGMGAYVSNYNATDEDGKTASKSQQYIFISAYMSDGSPSRIYVTGYETGYVGYVTLKDEEGKDFYGHCGGIAINGSTLWVTGEGVVNVAKASKEYSDAKKKIIQEIIDKAALTEGDKSIQFTASFEANNNASFCFYYDDPRYTSLSYDRLYVGEFYRAGNYETDKKHRVTTPNGYKNTAFMYEYNVALDSDTGASATYGLRTINYSNSNIELSNDVPKIQKIFSIPEQIQGVAFSGRTSYDSTNGMLVLSQSYGLTNSHLLCFDFATVMNSKNKERYTVVAGESFAYENINRIEGGNTMQYTDPLLDVYYVDKANSDMFLNDYSVPSMSEGMCVLTSNTSGNAASTRIYVLFESASKKYKHFVRQRLENVYSFIPHKK